MCFLSSVYLKSPFSCHLMRSTDMLLQATRQRVAAAPGIDGGTAAGCRSAGGLDVEEQQSVLLPPWGLDVVAQQPVLLPPGGLGVMV